MTEGIEATPNRAIETAVAAEQPPAEEALRLGIIKGILVGVPLSIGFFLGMVAIAVHNQHPNWTAMLSMAAGLGLLAGVFFGVLVGFMRTAHLFD
jgi:predicted ABC-type sugar transport system permease subunit